MSKSMTKHIRINLPGEEELTLVQAKVSKKLVDAVMAEMTKHSKKRPMVTKTLTLAYFLLLRSLNPEKAAQLAITPPLVETK